MSITDPQMFTTALATLVRQKFANVHRGALVIHCVGDGSMVAGVFGNDDYVRDVRARREVELVRNTLKASLIEELGFGISQDGGSWALLVRADCQRYQTKAGQAFQVEMLRGFLEDTVQGSWRLACGFSPEEMPGPFFEEQRPQ